MAKAKGQNTTTIKVRIPHILLKAIDEWAGLHGLPRSKAIQELVLRVCPESSGRIAEFSEHEAD
jgi:predicted DNA binding CopG/RHH family protein